MRDAWWYIWNFLLGTGAGMVGVGFIWIVAYLFQRFSPDYPKK